MARCFKLAVSYVNNGESTNEKNYHLVLENLMRDKGGGSSYFVFVSSFMLKIL